MAVSSKCRQPCDNKDPPRVRLDFLHEKQQCPVNNKYQKLIFTRLFYIECFRICHNFNQMNQPIHITFLLSKSVKTYR